MLLKRSRNYNKNIFCYKYKEIKNNARFKQDFNQILDPLLNPLKGYICVNASRRVYCLRAMRKIHAHTQTQLSMPLFTKEYANIFWACYTNRAF